MRASKECDPEEEMETEDEPVSKDPKKKGARRKMFLNYLMKGVPKKGTKPGKSK